MIDEAHVFLDTNILLHFELPTQIDWLTLCGARRVLLVIYPLLRKELSKAKDLNPNKRLRQRAGEREAWLRKCLASVDQPLRPGVFVFRDAKEPRALVVELGLDKEVNDDLIVAHAVSYVRAGKHVFVATADGGLEMKLEDQDISVLVLEDRLRLAPEPDPEKARADSLEREIRKMRDRLPELRIVSPGPCVMVRQCGYGEIEAYVEQGLGVADAAYRQQQLDYARIRHPGRGQDPRCDTIYNPKHEPSLNVARLFLQEQHRWLTLVEGAIQLPLTIWNAGKLTATDVRVRVFSPPHLTMYGSGGFGGQPRRRAQSEVFAGVPVATDELDLEFSARLSHGIGAPRVDRTQGVAEFQWPRIQQDQQVSHAYFWLTAGAEAPLGPTALRVEILCEEIGGKQERHIELVVVERP